MRINNNIMALNAHRQLAVNQTNASKSMERLSSGMRINRAGDDAAGLAISEKMRGQIRGLKQAQRNAQDGISLIQTAEGALNETHAILQRMRELATQASTDTNTLTDRKEIQKEINQLLDEIDRIAEQTEFNTQKLLDGTYSSKVFHIGANADQKMDVTISDMGTSAIGTAGRTGGGGSVTPGTPATGSVDIEKDTGTVTVTLTGPENDTYNGWTVTFTQAEDEDDGVKATVDADNSIIAVTWGSDNKPDNIDAINSAINAAVEEATLEGGFTLSIDGEAGFDAADLIGKEITISAEDGSPATGSVDIGGDTGTVTVTLTGPENDTYNDWTVKFTQSSEASDPLAASVDAQGKTITVTWGSTNKPVDIDAINSAIKNATDEVDTLIGDITLSIADGVDFDPADLHEKSIAISGGAAPAGGGSGTGENINSLLVDDENIDALAADWTDQQVADALQNAGSGVGVLTQAGANAAITNINDAIEQVSAERSKLGAMQNRLEHTIANLGTSAENLQAAEARIRDLDMAEEIMAFTKNNILQQAATAMLAQANMAPQSVLQLLG